MTTSSARSRAIASFLAVASLFGCNSNPQVQYVPVPVQQAPTRPIIAPAPPVMPAAPVAVAAAQARVDASAFNVELVRALMNSGQVIDPVSLQATINSPTSGINNVDIDGDGNVDPIIVGEAMTPNGGRQFQFSACPVTGASQCTLIATIDLVQQGGGIVLIPRYSTYVMNYDSYVFSPLRVAMNAAFIMWALQPSRSIYMMHPYTRSSWRGYGRMDSRTVETRRTEYVQKTKVSPLRTEVRASTKDSGYDIKRAPTTDRLSDRKGMLKSFKERDENRVKQRATAFDSAPAAASAPRAQRPASSAASRVASSPRPSSSRVRRR